ncbi:MAG TPA: hypothetical protein VN906_09260 [Candidatus Sulfotelmatobacter sp.]|nr:hypothetical protein [Candidatus Sulfotelmatobacter sp.]
MTAASLLINCWESASRSPARWRTLALVVPAVEGADVESMAGLPIGRLEYRLLELRRHLFGEGIEALASCPACSQQVDLSFEVGDITAEPPADTRLFAEHEDWSIQFRLPSSRDMQAAASCAEAQAARLLLIDRCVVGLTRESQPHPVEEAPLELVAAMEDAMAAADPQADLRFKLVCPACGAEWEAALDPGSFVGAEVSSGARRLLGEIHRLAAAYGWSEAEILGLPSRRRQAYLDLVTAE